MLFEKNDFINDKFTIDELLSRSWRFRSTTQFTKFFNFITRFHHYSRYNTMLVYIQNPAVTFFGGVSFWKKKFNRTMQMINSEYESVINDPVFKFSEQTDEAKQDYIKFPEIISQIISFDVVIEICGNWIWLSGNTRKYKKQLKNTGFFYAHLKRMWYWRPNDYKSANKKPMSINMIRRKYGSDVVGRQLNFELGE